MATEATAAVIEMAEVEVPIHPAIDEIEAHPAISAVIIDEVRHPEAGTLAGVAPATMIDAIVPTPRIATL
jgi:hypothetical protein